MTTPLLAIILDIHPTRPDPSTELALSKVEGLRTRLLPRPRLIDWITVGLLAIVTLMSAACQSNPKPAVMYRGGTRRTGLYDTQSVPELSGVKWKFETGDGIWPSPVVADGAVYVGSDDDHLHAVDTGTGEGMWKFQTGDDVHSSPAIADGVVYFGSWDHTVYAVDAQTGQETCFSHNPKFDKSSPPPV